MTRQTRLDPRRRPSQRRAHVTVDAILDAAARIFEAHGYARGTTNRIAERAGVSIGSLYEYFPSKDAIAAALFERELERDRAVLLGLLDEAGAGTPLVELLRRFVEATVELHARRPALHRLLYEEADHPPEAHACVLRFEAALAHAWEALLRARGAPLADPDLAAHLLVQTVEALAHRFVLRGLHDLGRDPFVAEVTALLAGYLGAATDRS